MTPREELQLRRQLKGGGLSPRQELDARRQLSQGHPRLEPLRASDSQNREIPKQATPSFADRADSAITGAVEPALALGSGALATPIANTVGSAKTMLSPAPPGLQDDRQLVDETQAMREALTFKPRTESGQENLQAIGEFFKPLGQLFGKAEESIGNKVLEKTGSPALAGLAATAPTLTTEVIGFGVAKGIGKIGKRLTDRKIKKSIKEAAPPSDQLKQVASDIYREIDDFGVTVKPHEFTKLVKEVETKLRRTGLDRDITPNTSRVLARMRETIGEPLNATDMDTLRKVASAAAETPVLTDKKLALQIVDSIDDFLDKGELVLQGEKAAIVGPRYKAARNLWGRVRRSESIQEAITTAEKTASGFENGIRIELRKIVNNKKKAKFFPSNEIAEMERVIKGVPGANLFKFLGKFGISERQATSMVGASIGAAGGAAAFGPAGAAVVPILGTLSKKLAQRLTKKGAQFADSVVRAGNDAQKITRAYLKHTPKALRSPSELSELLSRPGVDLTTLTGEFSKQLGMENTGLILGLSGVGASIPRLEQQPGLSDTNRLLNQLRQ